ncbi:MAG TPA: hypothetical protein VMR59_01585 [Patescibacteria group bacterium]|jgi:hypothetical protein|nr:hypothetical protein [Patescibacteria group bacterium]
MNKKLKKLLIEQAFPIFLTFLTFLGLATLLYGLLLILSSFKLGQPIILDFRRREVLFGIIIYLKTAIDFAIFTGNLMKSNPGWKKRIAIELGTAVGNGFGTFLILIIWTIFKAIPPLMIIMIFIASVVLLRMAQESFEEFLKQRESFIKLKMPVSLLQDQLNIVNKIFRPILRFFVPNLNLTKTKKLSFINLVIFSLAIPFVLGLDDFAGYIPLFTLINVFGFSLGILLGHMLLTIGLFAFPKKTVEVVKHPIVLIAGGIAFIGLGLYGFYESVNIFLGWIH